MVRTAALLALAIPLAAVAAPVPPPGGKELIAKYWGKTEGDAEFEARGKQLTMRLTSGKPNHQYSWNEKLAVPRTGHTVRGDFEVTVCVADSLPPMKDGRCDSGSPESNAGLYLMGGGCSFRFQLNQVYQKINGRANPDLRRWLNIQANYPQGSASGSIKQAEDGKSTYLRLARKGDAVTVSYSFDGEKWSAPSNPFRNINMGIPDEVTVGVFYSHSTYQFAHATFDGFTLGKPKGENEK